MRATQPGEAGTPQHEPGARRLSQPPSARYVGAGSGRAPGASSAGERSALPGPFAKAAIVGIAGAIAMVAIAAFIGSSLGLLFVAAATGITIGLVMARAAVPADDAQPMSRRSAMWLAVATVLAAVVLADVGIWLVALSEGGVLGLFDYLWTTFGATIPGVAIVAAITAAWGTSVGPVQG
jgi:hypothetical protein